MRTRAGGDARSFHLDRPEVAELLRELVACDLVPDQHVGRGDHAIVNLGSALAVRGGGALGVIDREAAGEQAVGLVAGALVLRRLRCPCRIQPALPRALPAQLRHLQIARGSAQPAGHHPLGVPAQDPLAVLLAHVPVVDKALRRHDHVAQPYVLVGLSRTGHPAGDAYHDHAPYVGEGAQKIHADRGRCPCAILRHPDESDPVRSLRVRAWKRRHTIVIRIILDPEWARISQQPLHGGELDRQCCDNADRHLLTCVLGRLVRRYGRRAVRRYRHERGSSGDRG